MCRRWEIGRGAHGRQLLSGKQQKSSPHQLLDADEGHLALLALPRPLRRQLVVHLFT